MHETNVPENNNKWYDSKSINKIIIVFLMNFIEAFGEWRSKYE